MILLLWVRYIVNVIFLVLEPYWQISLNSKYIYIKIDVKLPKYNWTKHYYECWTVW